MFRRKARKCDKFFAKVERSGTALGYNDVRLRTGYSEILPKDVDLRTKISRHIYMNIPIVSSPMDTVTEAAMAIGMAELGGLGIIHKNLTPEQQVSAVQTVKHKLSAFIFDPICVKADQTVREVRNFAKKKGYKFLSFPVVDNSGQVIGVVTSSAFEFCLDNSQKIAQIMSKKIISIPEGADVAAAYKMLMQNRIKILPMFNRRGKLLGIYTLADVKRIMAGDSAHYNLAPDGTLRVGAAIGVGTDERRRLELLVKAKVDVVVVDTAHGDSFRVIEMVKYCKRNFPQLDVIAGNVAEADAAKRLVRAGADGIRVGIGPGSICSTRIVAGVGCPQVSAVYNCAKALRGSGVPVCADGGIEYSGDITIALAAGASTVMIGKLLAAASESPGEVILSRDNKEMKVYRGMGSLGAMKENRASRERYGQAESSSDKLVPEGVEAEVYQKGSVASIVQLLLGGLRSGLGYCGAATIAKLQRRADFYRITPAGLRESHPHGLESFKQTLNYA